MSTVDTGTDLVQATVESRIMRVAMCRPEKKNALTVAMYEGLVAAWKAAEADPQVRVIFITGDGGAFTSGNDVLDFMNNPPQDENSPVAQFLELLATGKKAVVAAVNGVAVGIGTTMLLHCDLVYAAETATFRLPFVNLGLCPEAGSSYLLPQLMGHQRAAKLLMMGDAFDAHHAHSVGIVTELVADSHLQVKAWSAAEHLTHQPPAALRLCKDLMRGPNRAELATVMKREGAAFMERLGSPEAAEAFQAFMMKRHPDFSKFE
jgi:enoyl-CoA hydratase/carnithine racemase